MTNEELLALKELREKAKPFSGGRRTWEEMSEEEMSEEEIATAGYNSQFFIEAHKALPDLIDELLKFRQTTKSHAKWQHDPF